MELKDELGFSILFITHDLSLLLELADRIAVMYAGQLLEIGTSAEIQHAAAHPYTKGLLNSFPSLHGARRELAGIPGSPPDLRDAARRLPVPAPLRLRHRRLHRVDMSLAPSRRRHLTHVTACPFVLPDLPRLCCPSSPGVAAVTAGEERASRPTVSAAAAPLAMAAGLAQGLRLGAARYCTRCRRIAEPYRGAVVALVGESGSGKSTVARLLAGQDGSPRVTIRLDGEPVDCTTRRAFRRYKSEVQLVFQDPFSSLNPVHTVRYHLERPGPAAPGQAGSTAAVRKEVADLLEQVRLTPAGQFAGKYPHELSGGQRQRVSFARALAAKPSVLLADEPVSMLDVSIRLEMLSLLDDLRERLRLALLYITHDIASARYFADEMLVMYAGQIVERGPAEELTQHPAHPYTQLLVASAPDPDNLGSGLRSFRRPPSADRGTASATPTARPRRRRRPKQRPQAATAAARSAPDARSPTTAAARRTRRCSRSPPVRAAACWRLDVAAPDVLAGEQGGGE